MISTPLKNAYFKATFLVAITCLIGFTLITQQVEVQPADAQVSPIPYTVATYGNAWDGVIVFGVNNYLVAMATNGTILSLRSVQTGQYGIAKNIAQDTILFQGEPYLGGPNIAPTFAAHIWNVATNTTLDFPDVIGHHDLEYNPVDNTFLTLIDYVKTVGNNTILFDKILQLDAQGNVLWSWDTYDHIPLSQADPFNQTATVNGQTVIDFTHANALDWDYYNKVIYLNARHTNTFYKINQTDGSMIWSCGQFGNFTLIDTNGNQVPSLWYHSHDLREVSPNVFTMFNNDFDNITNYNSSNSQLLQITLNIQNMTAQTTWSWTAPKQYYSTYLGAADILPNGNWMGDFGPLTHQFVENQPWDFNDTGAVLIEVTPAGQIVRTITFPTGWSIYRIGIVTNLTKSAFQTPFVNPTPTQFPVSPPPESTPTPKPSPIPTVTPPPPTTSPTQTPSISTTKNPSSSPDLSIVTDVTVVVIVLAIAAIAILLYYKSRGRKQAQGNSSPKNE